MPTRGEDKLLRQSLGRTMLFTLRNILVVGRLTLNLRHEKKKKRLIWKKQNKTEAMMGSKWL